MMRARYPAWLPATALMLAVLAGAPRLARGQAPAGAAAAGLHFESYSFAAPTATGAKSVSLLSVPFAARVTVARGLSLAASGAAARGAVTDAAGSSVTLSGLTDTELRATLGLEREGGAIALALVGLVPSGHATLAAPEATVAGAIASDLLPFRVSNWGSGGGGAIDVTAIRAVDRGSVGLTAGYRISGEFQPLDGLDARYQPGSELRLRFAVDQTLAGDRTLALQLSYSRFGEDRWDGSGLLHAGQRVLAFATYAVPAGNSVVSAYGGALYRSGGALADALLRTGLLSGVAAPPSETLLLLGSSARVPAGASLLVPGLDFRLLRRADGTGQGLLLGIGGSAELPLGDGGARLVPSARLRIGRLLVAEGAESRVTGLEVGLGLSFGGAR